jgi:hypothetical protein
LELKGKFSPTESGCSDINLLKIAFGGQKSISGDKENRFYSKE